MQVFRHRRQRDRNGLTLIELLVTISIMATVASMFVVAYRSAATEATNIRTSATIRKISEVLVSRMQEYESISIEPMAIAIMNERIPGDARANASLVPAASLEPTTTLIERIRLFGLRKTIIQEMPEHPDDLKWGHKWFSGGGPAQVDNYLINWLTDSHRCESGLSINFIINISVFTNILCQTRFTSRTRRLIDRLTAIDPNNGNLVPLHSSKNGRPWDINEEPWEARNANAELLYLIIEDSVFNGASALELFGRSEVRDTDEDGLNEFVDAHGNPIRWIRWPSGSDISIRSHPDLMDPALAGVDIQGDPLDRSKADPGYAPYNQPNLRNLPGLRPLVISPGPDRRFGIRMQLDTPLRIGSPFPANVTSYSLGDVRPGSSGLPELPYRRQPCFVPDPWYPRNNRGARLGAPRTNTSRAAYDPNFPLESDYYDVAQDALDNISNLENAGGVL